jgi:drug/metabolite transporter (DMT)-like permease
MLTGVLCALGAGLVWGIVFVTPLLLGDYPGIVLSIGRYLAFGLIALVPAWFGRARIAQLRRADWVRALQLAFVGNLLYYALLASSIQLADVALPTMLVGTLPITIAVGSNWAPGHGTESIAWSRLLPSLLIIGIGLLLVNASELAHMREGLRQHSLPDYMFGCVLAVLGVLAWTWYPIKNAAYLRANPQVDSMTWATAQGLATLPLALIAFAGYGLYAAATGSAFDFPLGPRPLPFIGMMLLIGLTASWIGTLLWNQASLRLPTSLGGQLIVFETLFALLYAFILRQSLPPPMVAGGIVLLCAGVLLGMRAFRHQLTDA